MTKKQSYFVYSSELEKYPYPAGCPFNTHRVKLTRKIIQSIGLLSGENVSEIEPEPADRMVLKKFHTARYLRALKTSSDGKFDSESFLMGIGSPDCPVFRGMYEASALACGGTLAGADLIISGKADVVFNPSGGLHHAGPEKASGFCYINDVALACTVLAQAGKRVLYLDVDVHHGDGVADAFYGRSDVMTISFHETGRVLFPGTGFEDEIGSGTGKGYCVNVPVPVGTYDAAYMKAYKSIAVPLIEKFNPDVFVFELGADGLAGDPLGHLQLTNNTYAKIISSLLSFGKPILATGGGGYNIENTVRAWALAWSVLCSDDPEFDLSFGSSGAMVGITDRQGGLRDKELVATTEQSDMVIPAIKSTIESVKKNVFSYHGL